MNSGIYQILNTVNQKRYIGKTNNFIQRWGTHISFLKSGIHENRSLQKDWDEMGEDVFQFSILEASNGDLRLLEQKYLDTHKGNLYNKLAAQGKKEQRRGSATLITIRPTVERMNMIDKALELAGITKRQKFWFPRLMTVLLTSYVETIARDLRDVARLKDKIEEMENK